MRLPAFALTLLLTTSIFAQSAPRVAFIPVVNLSEKTPSALKTKQNVAAGEWLVRELERRSMRLTPIREIKAGLEKNKINPLNMDSITSAKLIALGQSLKVDFVIATVILNSKAQRVEKPKFNDMEGIVEAKYWLIDVARELPVINGKTITTKMGSKYEHLIDYKGDDKQVEAATKGMSNAFTDFLKDFKITKAK